MTPQDIAAWAARNRAPRETALAYAQWHGVVVSDAELKQARSVIAGQRGAETRRRRAHGDGLRELAQGEPAA